MAVIINTGSFPKDLKPLVKRFFGTAYKEYNPFYSQIFKSDPSGDAYEEYESFAELGMAQVKPQGSSIAYDGMYQLYNTRIQSITYALGFQVTREMVEDGKVLRIATRKATALKRSHLAAKETIGAAILNRAFDTNYTYGDGKALCVADHPTLGADVRNTLTVAADLSEASLEQALIDISAMTDNRGLKMVVTGNQLVVPKELQFEAIRILKGKERPGTADRDINAMNYANILQKDAIVHQYLTDADAWFILTSENETGNGLIHIPRRPLMMDEDNDFDTHNGKFQASERYAFGVGDSARCIFGSPGA